MLCNKKRKQSYIHLGKTLNIGRTEIKLNHYKKKGLETSIKNTSAYADIGKNTKKKLWGLKQNFF